jgi:hypothetical protein
MFAQQKNIKMSWDSQIEVLNKVKYECIDNGEINVNDKDLDIFTQKKKLISKKLKVIRASIKDRDLRNRKNLKPEAIKLSLQIRNLIDETFTDVEHLKQIHDKNIEQIKENDKFRDLMSNRDSIIRGFFTHIQDCVSEATRREYLLDGTYSNYSNEKNNHGDDYELTNYHQQVVLPDMNKIPDITIEMGTSKMDKNDIIIEKHLDNVLEGVKTLYEYGVDMNNKITTSNIILDEITDNVEHDNKLLGNTNKQLKDTLKKIRDPKKLCFDIFLILLTLGLIGLIIGLVLKK